jgi:hypothetical protein
MDVGVALAMQNPNRQQADHQVYWEERRLADLTEPLGFDSFWTVEHHFDNYTMVPDVCQFLTYMAGRTSRIKLGTAVIVLPWHDPVRVAEQISISTPKADCSSALAVARRASNMRASASRWKSRASALSNRPRSWSRP